MSILSEWFAPVVDFLNAAKRGPIPTEVIVPPALRVRPTTAHEAVARASGLVGEPSTYRLGGGADPLDFPGSPFDRDGTCDCSGFTAHVTGHARRQLIDGKLVSFYTDNVIRDAFRFAGSQWSMTGTVTAEGPQHLYLPVTREMEVRPGDLVVKPGKYVAGRRVSIGHIMIVVDVLPGFARARGQYGWSRLLTGVHCTPNRGRETAVLRGHPSMSFEARSTRNPRGRGSYFVRPRWYY
jgi:hypothetical protein